MTDSRRVSLTQRDPPWVASIVVLGAILYLPGLNWGLPGVVSWSQDTIAGTRTLGAIEGWPEDWKGRYPPLQHMILYAAYRPVLSHWEATGQSTTDPQTGEPVLRPPHTPKLGLLFLIAGAVSAVMAVAGGIGVWYAAKEFTADRAAAALAAAAFMSGAAYTYFAKLGNVDVPSMCWFAWSLYFYVRLLASRSVGDAAMLGLFGGLASATKDAVAGMYPGMAVALVLREGIRAAGGCGSASFVPCGPAHTGAPPTLDRSGRPSVTAAFWHSLFQWRWIAGLAAYLAVYLLINGAFADPGGFIQRLKHWFAHPHGAFMQREFQSPTQLSLGVETLRQAAGAVGWPMLGAIGASVAYVARRSAGKALILLAPPVGYYVLVIAPIRFVYERFLLAPLACLSILVGWMFVDLFRSRRVPGSIAGLILGAAFVPTLGYCFAVDLEMINDSRYAAEVWLRSNAPPSASIGGLTGDVARFRPQYLPRAHEMGYATYPVLAERRSFDDPQPDYLMLSSFDCQDMNAEQQACMDDLRRGALGYARVAEFEARFLGPRRSWLGAAGWFAPPPGKISPTITVFVSDGRR